MSCQHRDFLSEELASLLVQEPVSPRLAKGYSPEGNWPALFHISLFFHFLLFLCLLHLQWCVFIIIIIIIIDFCQWLKILAGVLYPNRFSSPFAPPTYRVRMSVTKENGLVHETIVQCNDAIILPSKYAHAHVLHTRHGYKKSSPREFHGQLPGRDDSLASLSKLTASISLLYGKLASQLSP